MTFFHWKLQNLPAKLNHGHLSTKQKNFLLSTTFDSDCTVLHISARDTSEVLVLDETH